MKSIASNVVIVCSVTSFVALLLFLGNIFIYRPVPIEKPDLLAFDFPLKAEVNGRDYSIDVVEARNKRVIISTKDQPGKFADLEIEIDLAQQPIEDYSNRELRFTGKGFSEPRIGVRWKEPGDRLPRTEHLFRDYELQMQFGQERDFRIPGQLKLESSEGVTVKAAGSFTAKTSDLVIVNGEIDIHQDNADTVLYTIEQFLKRVENVSQLAHIDRRGHSSSWSRSSQYSNPDSGWVFSTSTMTVDFDSGQGSESARFQMVRTKKGWQVYRVLDPDRLRKIVEVNLSLDTFFLFDHLGQQVVEQVLRNYMVDTWETKKSEFWHRYSTQRQALIKYGLTTYLVNHKNGSKQYVKLLVKKDEIWRIDQVFDGATIPQAHVYVATEKDFGLETPLYLSAKRLENSLNESYPNLQVGSAAFYCRDSKLFARCHSDWRRLVDDKEKCEWTRYTFERKDEGSIWTFVKELADDEELDLDDGEIKKIDKPFVSYCT